MRKIEGYIICSPINTWGDETKDKWLPLDWTFGTTPTTAWIRFLGMRPDNAEWDRHIHGWVNRGYCPKKATIRII